MKGDEYKMGMSNKTEGIIAILAAFFVLLSAMLNPKISAGLGYCFPCRIGCIQIISK